MKTKLTQIITLLILNTPIPMITAQSTALSSLLPGNVSGWKSEGKFRTYDTSSLYEYINGGAELYLSYGMELVISQIYRNGKEDEIRLEIFNMKEPKNAFGVFSHTRTKEENKFGDGSQYFTGAQIFWKGKYFISVIANDESPSIVDAINEIARKVDDKIQERGEKPLITGFLPKTGLVNDGFIYFHHYIWLNSFYFIADDNFLSISDRTEAILAKYADKTNRHYLLIINYPDKEELKKATLSFRAEFIESGEGEDIVKIEDGRWLGLSGARTSLVAVFNAHSDKEVKELLTKTVANINQQSIQP